MEPYREGDQVGDWRLGRFIGSGGFGRVFEVRDAQGRRGALKILRADAEARVRLRFDREARLLAQLDSPYVARLLDARLDGEPPYLVMAFVQGVELTELVEAHQVVAPARKLELALALARGLAALHRSSILHRDMKPSNALATADGAVLIDLGLGKSLETLATQLTATGAMMGTLLYLAPETVDHGASTAATDVYQWGLIVRELLIGRDLPADPLVVLHRRRLEPPPIPRFDDPRLDFLAQLVHRTLCPDPAGRPADGMARRRSSARRVRARARPACACRRSPRASPWGGPGRA